MIALIIAIYLLTTISFASVWFAQRNASITHGENFLTTFLEVISTDGVTPTLSFVCGIPAGMAMVLADSTMVGTSYAFVVCVPADKGVPKNKKIHRVD